MRQLTLNDYLAPDERMLEVYLGARPADVRSAEWRMRAAEMMQTAPVLSAGPELTAYERWARALVSPGLPACLFCGAQLHLASDPHPDAKGHQAWQLNCMEAKTKHLHFIDVKQPKGLAFYGFNFLQKTKEAGYTKKSAMVTESQMADYRQVLSALWPARKAVAK